MTGDSDMCLAVSQRGSAVTAYVRGAAVLAIPKRDGDFICTQDTGHEKSHASCDGRGRILARWPRSSVERYWQPGDCADCDHEHPPAVTPLCGPT